MLSIVLPSTNSSYYTIPGKVVSEAECAVTVSRCKRSYVTDAAASCSCKRRAHSSSSYKDAITDEALDDGWIQTTSGRLFRYDDDDCSFPIRPSGGSSVLSSSLRPTVAAEASQSVYPTAAARPRFYAFDDTDVPEELVRVMSLPSSDAFPQ